VQGRVAPGATRPTPQAVREGAKAAALFREVALASLGSREGSTETGRRASRRSPR
jgi:hypothetical protein